MEVSYSSAKNLQSTWNRTLTPQVTPFSWADLNIHTNGPDNQDTITFEDIYWKFRTQKSS